MALRFCRVSNLTSHAPATRPEIDKRSRREREGDRERERERPSSRIGERQGGYRGKDLFDPSSR